MTYICKDRGSLRCPCQLMEAGQCYTCNMTKSGKCDCQKAWHGICPYTEYMLNGQNIVNTLKAKTFEIVGRKDFLPELAEITFKVPLPYCDKSKELGSFVIADIDGAYVPLSVVSCKYNRDGGYGELSVVVSGVGPKTKRMLRECAVGSQVDIKGPLYNGILNSEKFDSDALSIIIAKGVAVMPFVNQKERLQKNMANFYLDTSKLAFEFLGEHFGDVEYEYVDLQNDFDKVILKLKKDYEYCLMSTGLKPNVLLLTSEYYAQKLICEAELNESEVLSVNHMNMCCGEGFCGACSFTDKNGVTVRGCKCNDI